MRARYTIFFCKRFVCLFVCFIRFHSFECTIAVLAIAHICVPLWVCVGIFISNVCFFFFVFSFGFNLFHANAHSRSHRTVRARAFNIFFLETELCNNKIKLLFITVIGLISLKFEKWISFVRWIARVRVAPKHQWGSGPNTNTHWLTSTCELRVQWRPLICGLVIAHCLSLWVRSGAVLC